MTIPKSFTGHCPTQNKTVTVERNYQETTDLSSQHKTYAPCGPISCDYLSFGNNTCEISKNCPLTNN